jgi:hypothetical protein
MRMMYYNAESKFVSTLLLQVYLYMVPVPSSSDEWRVLLPLLSLKSNCYLALQVLQKGLCSMHQSVQTACGQSVTVACEKLSVTRSSNFVDTVALV